MVSYLVYQFFNLVMLVLLIAVLLSWIPNVDWQKEPFYSLRKFSDSIFQPFRKFIPPIGMIDISPVFAFLLIGFLQQFLTKLLMHMGL